MTKYALIDIETGRDIGPRAKFEGDPPDESRKGAKWIPFVYVDAEIEDAETHRLGPRSEEVWTLTEITISREAVPLTDEERIARIKQEANERILAIADEIKQRNLIAHSVEVERVYRLGETPTAEQLAIAAAAEGIWSAIKSIRTHSNAMEADFSLNWDDLNG